MNRPLRTNAEFGFHFISQMFGSMQQSMTPAQSRIPGRLRSNFTVEEDDRLKVTVQQFPRASWNEVASLFPGKTPRQVRERYKNYLSPTLNQAPWTEAEDSLLRDKFGMHGPRWSILKQFFANRSDVNIKNRWSVLVSQRQRAQFPAGISCSPVTVVQPPPVQPGEPDFVAFLFPTVVSSPTETRRASLEFDPFKASETGQSDGLSGHSHWFPL
jgi:hypothetical protein